MSFRRRNLRTQTFRNLFETLPPQVRELAITKFKKFLENPDHPSLRRHELRDTHRGQHTPGSFSVSVTRSHRALYFEDGDTNVWYWIGTHADYDRFTGA